MFFVIKYDSEQFLPSFVASKLLMRSGEEANLFSAMFDNSSLSSCVVAAISS
jgi:hypothetical protein